MKRYKEYKHSGVEWIGEIPSHWDVKPLKYLITCIQTGSTPSTSNDEFFDGEIKWFTPGDFTENKYLCECKRNISKLAVEKKESRLLPKDTVLLVGIGATLGKVAMIYEKASFNQQITGLITNDKMLPQYLYYWLKMNTYTLLKTSNFTTLPIVNNEFIRSFQTICPSIKEQEIIVNYLDEKILQIDNLINKKEELIETLKISRQQLILDTVTKGLDKNVDIKDSGVEWIGEIPNHWETIQIKRLVKLYNGKEIKVEVEKSENSYNVYGSGGIFKYTNNYLYDGESVLFGRKGSIGKPIYIIDKFWTVDTMYYSVCDNKLKSKLFYYILTVFPWEKYTTKTALPSIVGSEIFNCRISLPMDTKEQYDIVKYLDDKTDKIDKIITHIENQIELLKKAKQKLITDVVTGKVDVR